MVEVFNTNVRTEEQANLLLDQLRRKYQTCKINFDLEDCDNILRVECHIGHIDVKGILVMLENFGFSAAILSDIPVSTAGINL